MDAKKAFVERIHNFFASVRLSLFLFGALAVSSILGTIIPQNAPLEQRLQEYGPKLNSLLQLLDLTDMYHSWWFRLLLVLLALNLILCSLRRLPKTLKLLRASSRALSAAALQNMHTRAAIYLPLAPEAARVQLMPVLRRKFSNCFWRRQPDGWQAVAEKGRLGRLGVYFVHLGVLLTFAGALIGSVFGFRGFVTIPEKSAVSRVQLRGKNSSVPLGFKIRCDKFTVDWYKTGAPKEYRSNISILAQGRIVSRGSIRVNHPFTYRGITFYQSDYGSLPSGIVLRLRKLSSGDSRQLRVPFRQIVTLPQSKDRLVVMAFTENLGNFGPAFLVALARENQQPASTWVLARDPEFHGNQIGDFRISVVSYNSNFYTGLQVKKDPGIKIIYAGFVFILLSMSVAFYISHRRLWLHLTPQATGTSLLIAGTTSKHSRAFEREFQQLLEEIRLATPEAQHYE